MVGAAAEGKIWQSQKYACAWLTSVPMEPVRGRERRSNKSRQRTGDGSLWQVCELKERVTAGPTNGSRLEEMCKNAGIGLRSHARSCFLVFVFCLFCQYRSCHIGLSFEKHQLVAVALTSRYICLGLFFWRVGWFEQGVLHTCIKMYKTVSYTDSKHFGCGLFCFFTLWICWMNE